MSALKNRAGTMIICYDDSERDSARVVTTLTQRGYDNVFLLSGGWWWLHSLPHVCRAGMTNALLHFPEHLIAGETVDITNTVDTKTKKKYFLFS
jgi:hypothetical protein